MKISTKLQGSAALIIGIIFIFVGVVLYVSVKAGQSGERNQIAQKILEASVTGVALRVEYGLTGEDRPKVQWYALHTILNNILSQAEPLFTEPANKTFYTAIREIQEKKKVTFDAVAVSIERGDNPELVARLNSQLAVNVQEGVNIATQLAELSREEHSAFHQMLKNIIGVFGLFTILFALISYFVSRTISSSLATLQQEFVRVASLDFSATTTTTTTTTGKNDEIGQLARAFNTMVGKLKDSYGVLEKKIRDRTLDLTKRTGELEKSQKAMLNVLADLKVKEQGLVEAKAKDEALLESIGDGVIAIDAEGKIILMNQSAQEMLGWHPENMTGRLFYDVVSIEDDNGNVIPREKSPVYLALAGTTTITGPTYNYVRRDKTKFPVAMKVTPVIIDNKIVGAIEIFRDVTKEKDIDKAKTEFVSLASHQLRTPLTTVSWYTEMILRGAVGQVTSNQKKYLDEIYAGNQRMIELVNTLLNLSRIEMGTFKAKPIQTDISVLAESALKEQQLNIEKKKLILIRKFSKNVPPFLTDPKLFSMVFQNLLANAVEYTSPGGTITLSVSKVKDQLLIIIEDTGYGIPKNQQDKVFIKFFRGDNVRAQDTDGTGLGLYIVKLIIENSGGKIWFESEENKGTTFYVSLPLDGIKNQTKKEY